MLPDRVLKLGPLALESDALPTAPGGPAYICCKKRKKAVKSGVTRGDYILRTSMLYNL